MFAPLIARPKANTAAASKSSLMSRGSHGPSPLATQIVPPKALNSTREGKDKPWNLSNIAVSSERSKPSHLAHSHPMMRFPSNTVSNSLAHNVSPMPMSSSRLRLIQKKLTINTPGDQYEQEADLLSERIMHMAEPGMPLPAQPQIHPLNHATIYRKCACGGTCKGCQHKPSDDEPKQLHLKRIAGNYIPNAEAPPLVHQALSSPGRPLDAATRAFMEPRFGHDFSQVRVHTGQLAARSANAVAAHAYAAGYDIVFGEGRYSPVTSEGQRLLAHELAHVVQQSHGLDRRVSRQPAPLVIDAGVSPAEDEMKNCMANVERLRAAQQAQTPFEICRRNLNYSGPDLTLTDDDRHQVATGEIIAAADVQEYAKALQDYESWVAKGWVTIEDRKSIEPQIVLVQQLLARYAPDALKVEDPEPAEDKTAASGKPLQAGVGIPAAIGVAVTRAAPVIETALERAAVNWGVAGVVPEATAAGIGVGGAVGVGLLSAAELIGATYLAYRFGRWIGSTATPVQTVPQVPDLIRRLTRQIRGVPNNFHPDADSLPVPVPRTKSRPKEDDDKKKRKKKFYPLCWPTVLVPPLYKGVVLLEKTLPPDRDFTAENQKALIKKWQRERKGDFAWGKTHIHHVIPLFLGGPDDLTGNGILLEAIMHLHGHRMLQIQPQLSKQTKPEDNVSPDIYDKKDHPIGQWYFIAGFKNTDGDTCGNPQVFTIDEGN